MGGPPGSQAAGAVLGQGYALAPSSAGQPPLQFSAPAPASRPDGAGAGFVMTAHAGGGVQLPFGGRMFSQVQAAAQAAAQQQPSARCALKGQRVLVGFGYKADAAAQQQPAARCAIRVQRVLLGIPQREEGGVELLVGGRMLPRTRAAMQQQPAAQCSLKLLKVLGCLRSCVVESSLTTY